MTGIECHRVGGETSGVSSDPAERVLAMRESPPAGTEREGGRREERLQRAGDTGVISHSRGVLVPAVEELYLGIKAEHNKGFVPRDVGVNWEWQDVDTCHTDGCGRATPAATEERKKRRATEERAGKIHTTSLGGTRGRDAYIDEGKVKGVGRKKKVKGPVCQI